MSARQAIAAADLEHCRAAIRTGSFSFYAASRVLPARVRDPALALYAFCRLADDEVDEGQAKARAVLELEARLAAVFRGCPRDAPEDRAFAAVVERFAMPRALPDALLEGLAWDAQNRRYTTLSDVRCYSARVAATVGAMMCVLMEARSPTTLARACDLGVAMQLTNIARDIGEDARAGRIYVPLDWLEELAIGPEAFLALRTDSPHTRRIARRLLAEAHRLYVRADPGIAALPAGSRPGIYAARHIYAAIGTDLARGGHDTMTRRAHTGALTKLGHLMLSTVRAGLSFAAPTSAVIYAPPLPETAFLVDAARTVEGPAESRAAALLTILADLKPDAMAPDRSSFGH